MMKAVKYVFLCACFLFVNFPLQADAAQKSEEVKLKSYMIDVTGDGRKNQADIVRNPF